MHKALKEVLEREQSIRMGPEPAYQGFGGLRPFRSMRYCENKDAVILTLCEDKKTLKQKLDTAEESKRDYQRQVEDWDTDDRRVGQLAIASAVLALVGWAMWIGQVLKG